MILPGLPTVSATLYRYGAQTIGADFLPASPARPTSIEAIEEPWRPNASVPRPDGETASTTRLFVCTVEVRGVSAEGTTSAARPDRIVSASGTWEVREVIVAPAMPMIPAAWHAYCVAVVPEDET